MKPMCIAVEYKLLFNYKHNKSCAVMAAAVPICQRSKCKNGIVLGGKGIQLRKELSLDHQHFIPTVSSHTWEYLQHDVHDEYFLQNT
jgi:hypothetical protein